MAYVKPEMEFLNGPPLMTPLQMAFTFGAIAIPTAVLAAKYLFAKDEISNEMLLGGGGARGTKDLIRDEMEFVKTAPWPPILPGLGEVEKYDALKEEALKEVSAGEDITDEARMRLRHALMDRCQVHVAWLLRLEREQRSIERMARRGMMSEADFQTFSRFAERLDTEVNEVREEAGWLCSDPARCRQASEEIWRIAVQIWHQRRQQDAPKEAQVNAVHPGACDDATRREISKNSLKGLKGGFLSKGSEGGSSAANSKKGKQSKTPSKEKSKKAVFEAMKWPEQLPGATAIREYEALKEKTLQAVVLTNDTILAEGEAKQCLRQALMERCQQQVPWMHRLQQEHQRVRVAIERARWQSGVTPTANDLGKLKDFETKCKAESAKVEKEAEWLGDKDGAPGMGGRIWPMAFELYAKANAQNAEREKLVRAHHEKTLKAYAERSAKPWPSNIPGITQRATYEQMKAAILKQLPQPAQAATLQGQPAPQVVGGQVARQLRAALMARCQQVVPLIQRLQAEGRAFNVAAERGHVDDDDVTCFHAAESNVKAEIDAVKVEAEWLSDDTGTRAGMGDQIWPAAFQIYAKRRAEIAKQIQAAQMQRKQASVVADTVD